MSKELTEKWVNGTLEDGLYYALTSAFRFNAESVIERAINGTLYINGVVDFNVKEVLTPVPTYDQFVQLVKRAEELEKRLAAVKANGHYPDKISRFKSRIVKLSEQNAELLAKYALLRDEIKEFKSSNWGLNTLCNLYQKENAELLRKIEELEHRLYLTKAKTDDYKEVNKYESSSDRH